MSGVLQWFTQAESSLEELILREIALAFIKVPERQAGSSQVSPFSSGLTGRVIAKVRANGYSTDTGPRLSER